MGVLSIPSEVRGGTCRASIELDKAELATTVARVKDLADKLARHRAGAGGAGGAGGIGAGAGAAAAAAAPARTVAPPPPARAGAPPPAQARPAPTQPVRATERAPPPPQALAPPPAAPAAMPAGLHAFGGVHRAGPAPPPPPPQQQQQFKQLYYRKVFATSTGEHNAYPITAVAYAPSVDGLPGGEGHGGWLISASQNQCVLWECSRADPQLQMMHAQETVHTILDMELAMQDGMLFGAGVATGTNTPGVAMHSLAVDDGFLAVKGQMALLNLQGLRPPPPPLVRCVRSLRPLDGPIASHVAVACGTDIILQPARPEATSRALHEWTAHSRPVTSLRRSQFHIALISGGADGDVRVWDLKTRPVKPSLSFGAGGPVAEASFLSHHLILAAGASRTVQLWDARRPGEALQTVAPDGNPVISVAIDNLNESIVCCTPKGVYCCELKGGMLSPLASLPGDWGPGGPTQATWNDATGDLYVGTGAGSVSVFRPSEF